MSVCPTVLFPASRGSFPGVLFSPISEHREKSLCLQGNGVVIRDKVGNYSQFDDKTLFGNESNLHTKIAFTNNTL